MVDAGKDSAAGEGVDSGVGIAPRDEDAFFRRAGRVFPLDGDPVGAIFAPDAGEGREAFRADFFEADEADSGDRVAVVGFEAERRGKNGAGGIGIHPIIHQDATFDDAGDCWDFHEFRVYERKGLIL